MATRSMTGLKFVQEHLSAHLQPYAHLIPSVVNSHVGWLGKEDKEVALLYGMAALDKAWKRWQETPEQYSEKQFFGFARKRIWGVIMDSYKDQIAARRPEAESPEVDVPYPGRQPSAKDFGVDLDKVIELMNQFAENSSRSLTDILREVPYESRSIEDDSLITQDALYEDDPEYDDGDDGVTDKDGEYGYGLAHYSGSSRPLLKLYRLLPLRESVAIRLRSRGATFEVIGDALGVSRARAQQLWEQAQQRFFDIVVRLRQGENAVTIMTEADKLSQSAQKKSEKILARRALPFTNSPKPAD